MLINIYTPLLIATLSVMLLAFLIGSRLGHKGIAMTFFLLSAITFGVLGFESLNMETIHCENQITSTITNTTHTQYENTINCHTHYKRDEGLAILTSGLALFAFAIMWVYVPMGDGRWHW